MQPSGSVRLDEGPNDTQLYRNKREVISCHYFEMTGKFRKCSTKS